MGKTTVVIKGGAPVKNFKKLVSVAVATALAGNSLSLSAAGFALIEQNASGMGNAYAGGAAVAEDASTIYFNPAGMTRIPGRQAVGALHAIRPKTEFTDTGSSAPGVVPGLFTPARGGNGGDAGDWA